MHGVCVRTNKLQGVDLLMKASRSWCGFCIPNYHLKMFQLLKGYKTLFASSLTTGLDSGLAVVWERVRVYRLVKTLINCRVIIFFFRSFCWGGMKRDTPVQCYYLS